MPTYEFYWLDEEDGLQIYRSDDLDFSHEVGSYWNAIRAALDPNINDPTRLERFVDQEYSVPIIHKDGTREIKTLIPVSDMDTLIELYYAGELDLDEVIEGT